MSEQAMEPDFISQNGEPMSSEQRREWWRTQVRDAEARGAQWHRFSCHPVDTDLILYEGWKVRPVELSEPRFQFMAAAECAKVSKPTKCYHGVLLSQDCEKCAESYGNARPTYL